LGGEHQDLAVRHARVVVDLRHVVAALDVDDPGEAVLVEDAASAAAFEILEQPAVPVFFLGEAEKEVLGPFPGLLVANPAIKVADSRSWEMAKSMMAVRLLKSIGRLHSQ